MSTHVRERVAEFHLKSTRAARLPFGLSPAELITAALVLILFSLVVVYYFNALVPERNRLAELEEKERAQEAEIARSRTVTGQQTAQQTDTQPQAALDSLNQFKQQYVRPVNSTVKNLLDEINKLAKKHGVQLTSGIPVELRNVQEDEKSDSKQKKEERALDAFSTVKANFTVAGDYAKLQSFIRELENSKLFVIINSITLINQEEKETGEGRRSGASGIMLTINLSVPVDAS